MHGFIKLARFNLQVDLEFCRIPSGTSAMIDLTPRHSSPPPLSLYTTNSWAKNVTT